jgi:hypothetical protein
MARPDSPPNQDIDSDDSGDEAISPRDVAVGLALYTAGAAWNTASSAYRLTRRAARFFLSPVRRVAESSAMEPVRTQLDLLQVRVEQGVEKRVQIGLAKEPSVREAANKVVDPVLNGMVGYMSNHPAIKKLVQDQIVMISKGTDELPEINVLVRVLVDNYIAYLNQNPTQVQNLASVQGLSMAEEITDALRERLVTGDSALEALARRLFQRKPRFELPGPPAEVQAWGFKGFVPEKVQQLMEIHDEEQ